jgi:hypothetical protein
LSALPASVANALDTTSDRRPVAFSPHPAAISPLGVAWPIVLGDAAHGTLQSLYEGGRIGVERFVFARWELSPQGRYMWGSVQTSPLMAVLGLIGSAAQDVS